MRTRKIVEKLILEHQKDVEYNNNYDVLKERLSLSQSFNQEKSQYNHFILFKYATAILSIIVLLLIVSNIFLLSNKTKEPEVIPSKEEYVYQYFESISAKYIKEPIRTESLGDALIYIYFGITDGGSAKFAYIVDGIDESIALNITSENSFIYVEDKSNYKEPLSNKSIYANHLNYAATSNQLSYAYSIKFEYNINDESVTNLTTIYVKQYIDYLKNQN